MSLVVEDENPTSVIAWEGSEELIMDAANSGLPREFAVSAGYPNPFNSTIAFHYAIPKTDWISAKVYNLLGQLVHQDNQYKGAGYHTYIYNPSFNLTSGVYFLK